MFESRGPRKGKRRRALGNSSDDENIVSVDDIVLIGKRVQQGMRTSVVTASEPVSTLTVSSATESVILTGGDALRLSEVGAMEDGDGKRYREAPAKLDPPGNVMQKGSQMKKMAQNSTSTGKFGPQRVVLPASVTFDYQQDICKDYKDSGYCGFGDSCKFLHDRSGGDSGWKLDRQFQDQAKRAARENLLRFDRRAPCDEEGSAAEAEKVDTSQACGSCKRAWSECETAGCRTTCGHYFCESCFLRESVATCKSCGKPTNGIFNAL